MEGQDIFDALQKEVQFCAIKLICLLKANPNVYANTICIILAGLGLHRGDPFERISSSCDLLTTGFALGCKEARAKRIFERCRTFYGILEVPKSQDVDKDPSI